MIGTLEDRRIKQGDFITVSLRSGEYPAEVIDSSDMSKLKIKLESGRELWVGRKCVVGVDN